VSDNNVAATSEPTTFNTVILLMMGSICWSVHSHGPHSVSISGDTLLILFVLRYPLGRC